MRRARTSSALRALVVWSGLLFLALGCTARAHGTRPDDMSATEHRTTAAEHDAKARRHEASHDPDDDGIRAYGPIEKPDRDYGSGFAWPSRVYSPSAPHLRAAARHLSHARAHREAADKLERFEESECRKFPPATRAICPLDGTVVDSTDIDGGVRVRLKDRLPVAAAVDHIRCHMAFGRVHEYVDMDTCPLYLKGVHVAPSPDGKAVEITSGTKSVIREIRARTRTHLSTPGGSR